MMDPHMTDHELDRLLAAASKPELPAGALVRLNARIAAEEGTSNVVTLQPRNAKAAELRSRLGWLAGLPLAASLVLGIYLGNSDTAPSFLTDTAYELLSGVDLDDTTSGIEDALNAAEEDKT